MYAECRRLCQVHNIEHSAKLLFAECLRKSTRQTDNTRRKKTLPSASHVALGKATLCRVPKSRHSANAPLPSAAWAALGNKCHVRHTSPHTPVVSPHTPVTRGPPLFFAECLTVCTRQRQSRAPHTTVTRCHPVATNVTLYEDRYRYDLPSARLGTLGKTFCAECQLSGTRQSSVNAGCNRSGTRH